jgi:menaquinone-dependent protoporphyrinogen IX oxidase
MKLKLSKNKLSKNLLDKFNNLETYENFKVLIIVPDRIDIRDQTKERLESFLKNFSEIFQNVPISIAEYLVLNANQKRLDMNKDENNLKKFLENSENMKTFFLIICGKLK